MNTKCPPRNRTAQLSTPYTEVKPSSSLPPKFLNLNFHVWNIAIISTMRGYFTQRSTRSAFLEIVVTHAIGIHCAGAVTE